MRGVWEGLKKATDAEVDQVITEIETGAFTGEAVGDSGKLVEAPRPMNLWMPALPLSLSASFQLM